MARQANRSRPEKRQSNSQGQRAWQLSQTAEQAVARLVKARCDADRLRVAVHVARQLNLKPFGRRRVRSLTDRIARLERVLSRLIGTQESFWLYPPMGPANALTLAITSLESLRLDLTIWLERTGRRQAWRDLALAALCAYVKQAANRPHDREIADLWADVEPSVKSPKTAESIRQFRKHNARLIRLFLLPD